MHGELMLQAPLISWLRAKNGLCTDTKMYSEVAWYGRHIDLVIVTGSGRTLSYELKLRNNRRAVTQAMYNKLSCDESYVVTATMPSEKNRRRAEELGVGIIVVRDSKVELLLPSTGIPDVGMKKRLLAKAETLGEAGV